MFCCCGKLLRTIENILTTKLNNNSFLFRISLFVYLVCVCVCRYVCLCLSVCLYVSLCVSSFQPVLHDWCNKGRGMLSCLWDGAYKRTLAR